MAKTSQRNRGYDARIEQRTDPALTRECLDLIYNYKEKEMVSLADAFDLATYAETASIGELEEATKIMNQLHDNKN